MLPHWSRHIHGGNNSASDGATQRRQGDIHDIVFACRFECNQGDLSGKLKCSEKFGEGDTSRALEGLRRAHFDEGKALALIIRHGLAHCPDRFQLPQPAHQEQIGEIALERGGAGLPVRR